MSLLFALQTVREAHINNIINTTNSWLFDTVVNSFQLHNISHIPKSLNSNRDVIIIIHSLVIALKCCLPYSYIANDDRYVPTFSITGSIKNILLYLYT